jgi:hypothetical protein
MYFLNTLPQRLSTTATPTFAGLNIGSSATQLTESAAGRLRLNHVGGTNPVFELAESGVLTAQFYSTAGAVNLGSTTNKTVTLFANSAAVMTLGTDGTQTIVGAAPANGVSALWIRYGSQLANAMSLQVETVGTNQRPMLLQPTGSCVLIGTSVNTSSTLLQIGTNTATAVGGVVFGTDTGLYRGSAGRLRLDHLGGNTPVLELCENGTLTGQFYTTAGALNMGTATNKSMSLFTNSTQALTLGTDQVATFSQYVLHAGQSRVSAQFDKNASTALGNVTGLTVNVAAGKTYYFRAKLILTCAAAGGCKIAIAGTATATTINYTGSSWTATALAAANATALGTAVGAQTAIAVGAEIFGTITVNAAGTLTVQFAQNAASGTSSVLVGSFFEVMQIA